MLAQMISRNPLRMYLAALLPLCKNRIMLWKTPEKLRLAPLYRRKGHPADGKTVTRTWAPRGEPCWSGRWQRSCSARNPTADKMNLAEDTAANPAEPVAAPQKTSTRRLAFATIAFCVLIVVFWLIAWYFRVKQLEDH